MGRLSRIATLYAEAPHAPKRPLARQRPSLEPVDRINIPTAMRALYAKGPQQRLTPRPFVSRSPLCCDAGARLQRGHSLSSGLFDAIGLAVGSKGSDRDDRTD